MYAWAESRIAPQQFGDKESIVGTGSQDFTSKTTIVYPGDKVKKESLGNVTGPIKEDRETRSFAERFREFGDSTTFHGVGHVTNYKHNGIRR